VAEIVCYMYIFHLTWPISLHYLVKCGCSQFLHNTILQSDCSDLVSKWRGHTVATTFLLWGHCQTCTGCPMTSYLCLNRTASQRTAAPRTRHRRFLGARQRRERHVVV